MSSFTDEFSYEQLKAVFRRYHNHCYDHLMRNPVAPLSEEEMRTALERYFVFFTDDRDERKIKLREISSERNYCKFYQIMNDQHYEEPLFHIANQNTMNYLL